MSVLSDEIDQDPEGKGYAALLPDKPGHVVDLLNAETELVNARTIMTGLKLMDVLGVTIYESVMNKLDAIAPSRVIVRDFLARIRADSADVGSPTTLEMIDQVGTIPAPNGFTAEEVTVLKAMSLQYLSRAEVLGLPYMTEELLRNR
jgi:hypothetical protein